MIVRVINQCAFATVTVILPLTPTGLMCGLGAQAQPSSRKLASIPEAGAAALAGVSKGGAAGAGAPAAGPTAADGSGALASDQSSRAEWPQARRILIKPCVHVTCGHAAGLPAGPQRLAM